MRDPRRAEVSTWVLAAISMTVSLAGCGSTDPAVEGGRIIVAVAPEAGVSTVDGDRGAAVAYEMVSRPDGTWEYARLILVRHAPGEVVTSAGAESPSPLEMAWTTIASDYDLDAGRLFLLDLRVDPPAIAQKEAPLPGLSAPVDPAPQSLTPFHDFAVGTARRLAETDPAIRTFWN